MKQGRRLLFYIVLNIIVSACTTLAVLWLWNRPRMPDVSLLPVSVPTSGATVAPATAASTPQPTAPEAAATLPAPSPTGSQSPATAGPTVDASKQIVIDNVIGVGNLKDEYVMLKNNAAGEVSLANWRLDDGNGNTYTFPTLTLYKGGAVQIHTAAGVDGVIDLYWGRSQSVWQVGKIVTLYDDKGQVRASYRIP
jgi:hypothetical protein